LWTPEYDRGLFIQDMLSPYYTGIVNSSWLEGWGREIRCFDNYLGASRAFAALHNKPAR
jgi:ribosome modulation factor